MISEAFRSKNLDEQKKVLRESFANYFSWNQTTVASKEKLMKKKKGTKKQNGSNIEKKKSKKVKGPLKFCQRLHPKRRSHSHSRVLKFFLFFWQHLHCRSLKRVGGASYSINPDSSYGAPVQNNNGYEVSSNFIHKKLAWER